MGHPCFVLNIESCCILSNHVALILDVALLDIFIGCNKKQLTSHNMEPTASKHGGKRVGSGRPLLSPNSFKKGEVKQKLYRKKWFSHHQRISLEISVHESWKNMKNYANTRVTPHLQSICCHWNSGDKTSM